MSAVETLIAYAKTADPFRNPPADLAELQLAAVRERFKERREQIKVLDKRACDAGISEINTWQDVVPLLFAHTNYKSYPEAFIDNGQWRGMNAWLQTLSAYPTGNIKVEGVRDVDDWLDNARDAGHFIFASSGTSGKSSFLNQSGKDREFTLPQPRGKHYRRPIGRPSILPHPASNPIRIASFLRRCRRKVFIN